MRLWQRLARRAHALPDEGDGVHAEEVDANVGEVEHLAGHCAEDGRVAVVEVELVVVEGRPYPAAVGELDEGAGVVVTV